MRSAPTPRDRLGLLRRGGVAIAGSGMIALGAIMLVVPGPGILTIVAGLGLLSTEFESLAQLRKALLARWQRARDTQPAERSARAG